MKIVIHSESTEDTFELGRRIGEQLKGRDILLCEGELGSGKTLLTKGIYAGLGGQDTERILSPSYTLVHQYHDARLPIFHIDLYRLENPKAIFSLDYEEFLYTNPGVSIIEWPRGAKDLLDREDYLHVVFSPGDQPTKRTIEIEALGDHYLDVFAELSRSCSS